MAAEFIEEIVAKSKLLIYDGFIYIHHINKGTKNKYFDCRNKHCLGRILFEPVTGQYKVTREHSHGTMDDQIEELRYRKACKARCSRETRPIRVIIQEVFYVIFVVLYLISVLIVIDDYECKLGFVYSRYPRGSVLMSNEAMRLICKRIRSAIMPPVPISAMDAAQQMIDYPNRATDDQDQPFYRGKLGNSPNEGITLVFMSDKMMSVLKEATHISMDGTFTTVPVQFMQLYTIMAKSRYDHVSSVPSLLNVVNVI
jgi:hypothetical protein